MIISEDYNLNQSNSSIVIINRRLWCLYSTNLDSQRRHPLHIICNDTTWLVVYKPLYHRFKSVSHKFLTHLNYLNIAGPKGN